MPDRSAQMYERRLDADDEVERLDEPGQLVEIGYFSGRKMGNRTRQDLVRVVDLSSNVSVLEIDEAHALNLEQGAQAQQRNGARYLARSLRSSPPRNSDLQSRSKMGKAL